MRLPSRRILPASTWSSVPSRCRSVLFPEPDWPTTLRNSPACTSRFRPRSTSQRWACLRYVLWRLIAVSMTRSVSWRLLEPQRPDRVQHGGTQRGQNAEQHRDGHGAQVDHEHAQRLDVHRDAVEIINAAIKDLLPRDARQDLLNVVDVLGDGQPQECAEAGADQSQQQAVAEKDLH